MSNKDKAHDKKQAQPKGILKNHTQPGAQSKPKTPIPPSSTQRVRSPSPSPAKRKGPTADDIKEQGNVAFKAKNYTDAIALYTRAIELKPTEPSYLANRAAAYMALKRFRTALADCQQAAALESAKPSSKTLIRLVGCHLALGSPQPALATLRTVIGLEPTNAAALQLQDKARELDARLRRFDGARRKKEWETARLALDECLQCIRGEGGEVPTRWRLWGVELDLARARWDAADVAASDVMRLDPNSPEVLAVRGLVLFLLGKLPQALEHVASALRLDPEHQVAARLRKRIKDVERIKDEGNAAFKSGRLVEAVALYTMCLERTGTAEEEGKGGPVRATLLSNRATTLVKLKKYDEAWADTEASLALLPTSLKALRTRARIHLHFDNFNAALADFGSCIEQAESERADADVRSLRIELKKAEVALEHSKTKDYYKILGVPRDCADEDIEKAYRRLKQYLEKGRDKREFKLVVEANAVLSDPRRRERYDMGEDQGGPGMAGMGDPFGGTTDMFTPMEDMFAPIQDRGGMFGGGAGGNLPTGGRRRGDLGF